MKHDSDDSKPELSTKLNLETGKMDWNELQKFFARGVLVVVDSTLDLVDVAERLAADDKDRISQWIEQGLVTRANDDHAKQWHQSQSVFWAVVVAPWVVVQNTDK
ncbi:MAG: DUF2288 domain-containing protein [Gammaproteobacteria bacterium]|nr:DUF2288 domain-containing protein [Gammaproteobacteria bacterium]MDH5728386.1 DUF2288 domain-containing protein [Gammaproteobacteria bacterium]